MAAVLQQRSVNFEFLPTSASEPTLPASVDPFRHDSVTNSHNHHNEHPWGPSVQPNTREFDSLYAEANNQYMYHLWYNAGLSPFMATKVLLIHHFDDELLKSFESVVRQVLTTGLEAAIASPEGQDLIKRTQNVFDGSELSSSEKIFVRLGATSAKDSFAMNEPTAKPSPMAPDGEVVVRRLLTSCRCVGRLLALSEGVWPGDPGEALVVQRWSPDIELRREFRVFCYQGRVTAISQDIWWEDLGWHDEDLNGFVEAITLLWSQAKDFLPFETCTMDVLMERASEANEPWKASIIEFNGFGGHLNTGSDLFHWLNDAHILKGEGPGVTIRFVGSRDDPEIRYVDRVAGADQAEEEVEMPDWLALETKLRATYGNDSQSEATLRMESKAKLPLRGRWCSAY